MEKGKKQNSNFGVLTVKIREAVIKATILHYSQKRKTRDVPFIIHPYSVALILTRYTNDENIIAAGLLHDVLEDVPDYTFEDLKRDFGDKIAQIVKEVSEDKEGGESLDEKKYTWKKRKEGYLETLRKANQEALMVSCADKIHNLTSLIEDYESLGESVWNKFNASRNETSWFYESVLLILEQRLNSEIVKELEKIYREAKQIMIK